MQTKQQRVVDWLFAVALLVWAVLSGPDVLGGQYFLAAVAISAAAGLTLVPSA